MTKHLPVGRHLIGLRDGSLACNGSHNEVVEVKGFQSCQL